MSLMLSSNSFDWFALICNAHARAQGENPSWNSPGSSFQKTSHGNLDQTGGNKTSPTIDTTWWCLQINGTENSSTRWLIMVDFDFSSWAFCSRQPQLHDIHEYISHLWGHNPSTPPFFALESPHENTRWLSDSERICSISSRGASRASPRSVWLR